MRAVEEEGVARRLGIAREEVARRRGFVERVRGVVRVRALLFGRDFGGSRLDAGVLLQLG